VPRLTFTAGEILTAANMNVISDSTVMVFDDAAARDTAIPSPTEGMVVYLKDTDALLKYTTSWVSIAPAQTGVLQVVSTTKTDVFSSSIPQATYEAITGLTVSITPSSTSSKILIVGHVVISGTSDISRSPYIKLLRGATVIGLGDTAGDRARVHSGSNAASIGQPVDNSVLNFLDSPNTTSALTYSVEIGHNRGGAETISVNRSRSDPDEASTGRGVSTITAMEVAG